MSADYEQSSLWSRESQEINELRALVDRTRQAWQQVRLVHAIGSPEEQQYWDAYRAASDRLWHRVYPTSWR